MFCIKEGKKETVIDAFRGLGVVFAPVRAPFPLTTSAATLNKGGDRCAAGESIHSRVKRPRKVLNTPLFGYRCVPHRQAAWVQNKPSHAKPYLSPSQIQLLQTQLTEINCAESGLNDF